MKGIRVFLIGLLLFSAAVRMHSGEEILLVKVRVQIANVRAEPDLHSRIIGRVEKNALFETQAEENGWYPIAILSSDQKTTLTGYIHKSLIEIISSPADEGTAAEEIPKAAETAAPAVSDPAPLPAVREEQSGRKRFLERMVEIEKRIRKDSLALLSLIKTMQPEETGQREKKTVEMVRMVSLSGAVTETMDAASRVIYSPRINEEFRVLDKVDAFFKVRLQDGREGWLPESAVQVFSGRAAEAGISFAGVKDSEIKRFLEMAEEIFSRISQNKLEADHLVSLADEAGLRPESAETPFGASRLRIEKYYGYALDFHHRFIRDRAILFADTASFATRVSAWTELLLGSQGYATEYLAGNEDLNRGMTRDISLGSNLLFSEKSRIGLTLSNKRDIIQTPYGMSDIDAQLSHEMAGGLKMRMGFNLNTYSDDMDDLNNFTRASFRAGTDYSLTPQVLLGFNYAFLNNAYSANTENSYSDHSIQAFLNHRTGSGSIMSLRLRGRLESSDSPFRNFVNIEPSVGYETTRTGARTSYRADYEKLAFTDLELRNFDRITLTGNWSRSLAQAARNSSLALTYKSFPNNDLMSYIQARGRYSYSRHGPLGVTFSPSFNTSIFTGNTGNSFTDLRLDTSGTSRRLFAGMSTYFRFWHSPGNGGGEFKPHVLDLSGRLGLNLGTVRIGPTVSVHALLSTDDQEFFKRDGNLFRLGGFAEGRLSIPGGGSLNLDASYEHGFVYTQEIAVNPQTGLMTFGDLVQRHPTSMQSNVLLAFPLGGTLELIGRFSYYRILTDMDASLSIYPITSNSRLILLTGLRFRHN